MYGITHQIDKGKKLYWHCHKKINIWGSQSDLLKIFLAEIFNVTYIAIILDMEQITKGLTSLHICAGWSAPLLFTYNKPGVVLAPSICATSKFSPQLCRLDFSFTLSVINQDSFSHNVGTELSLNEIMILNSIMMNNLQNIVDSCLVFYIFSTFKPYIVWKHVIYLFEIRL